jgi:Flp pilus assembly protein CpaB
MEMEFKDNSRRRTLVLVVGVLLALGAGAAAFMLSSQGQEEPETVFPTRDVVVAADFIPARETIQFDMLTTRSVPLDESNEGAFSDPAAVAGKVAGISIVAAQPITPYMLAQAQSAGSLDILEPDETIAPDSPVLRAVSLTVPPDRAVGGYIATNDRVDVIATFPMNVTLPTDPETGQVTATNPETGEPFDYILSGSSTKLMWLDMKIITRPEDTADTYIIRTDLQTAEEIAHAQNQGAQFTMALRPKTDIRDVDRSNYGETNDTLVTRYNFRIPESINGTVYPQPIAFPTPFPAEPYLDLTVVASPSPDPALIEIDVDQNPTGEGLVEESPLPGEEPAP